jgi:trehalose 6-phosphate phosphatase
VVSKKVLPYLDSIQSAADAVEEILLPDMQLENKEVTLSIHYRQTDDPDKVWSYAKPRLEIIADQLGLDLFEGRMIFELRPPVKEDKGSAFAYLVEEHQLDGAVFLGDDITDTAAFIKAAELKEEAKCLAFSVGVQEKGTPDEVLELSDVNVAGVQGVEGLLAWFANNLRASST